MSNFLKVLGQISNIKKTEVVLPISMKSAVVKPLTVGDDISLKSSILSPANLDMELLNLIYKHTEFIEPLMTDDENSENQSKIYKPKLNDFLSETSHIDKLLLLWGIYKATYETLGERPIRCKTCNEIYKKEIMIDDLIQEDSITLLEDENTPFWEWNEIITIPLDNKWMIEFKTRIPSCKNYNNIMSFISIPQIQENLEKIKTPFDTTQYISLFSKSLAVYLKDKPEERSETSNLQEIIAALNQYVELPTAKKFLDKYDDLYGKYMPKFYTKTECSCGAENEFVIDIELELV